MIISKGTLHNEKNRNTKRWHNNNSSTKRLKVSYAYLGGGIFDCSDYKQADKYITTSKRICEYVGSKYKQGGNIPENIKKDNFLNTPEPKYLIDEYGSDESKITNFKHIDF